MAITFCKYWARFAIAAGVNDTFKVSVGTPTVATLAPGTGYYVDSDPATATGLLAALKAAIEAAIGGGYTVEIGETYSGPGATPSQGQIVLRGGSAWTLDFATGTYGTALRDLMGFTTDVNASDGNKEIRGVNPVQYAWYPSQPGRSAYDEPQLSGPDIGGRSVNGVKWIIGSDVTIDTRSWEHRFLSRDSAFSPASPNESWGYQDLWLYTKRTGERFRFWTDRTLDRTSFETFSREPGPFLFTQSDKRELLTIWTVFLNLWREVDPTTGLKL